MGHIGWLARDEGEDCTTVAWCDINEERVKSAAEKHPEVATYTDYREMVKHPGLDAVAISTPNMVHAEQCIAFLEAGKDVFLEKPMGVDKGECDRILEAVIRTGRKLTVDFEMRVSPFAERVMQTIESAQFGSLRRMEFIHHRGCWLEEGSGLWRVRPEQSGGHFFMEPIHEVDIMRLFAGEVKAVQTISGPNVLPQYNFPDNLCCHLFFESGVQAVLLASHTLSAWMPWKEQDKAQKLQDTGHDMNMILTFERASIEVDFIRARLIINPIEVYPEGTVGKRVMHDHAEEFGAGDFHAFAHDITKMRKTFIRRLAEGQPMVQDPVDIWKTHMVCLAAEKSACEEGQRIEIDYTLPEGCR